MVEQTGAPRGAAVRAATGRSANASALLERAGRWQGQLRDDFAALNSDVEFDLRRRVQTVVVAAEGAVAVIDPAKGWLELCTWLRDRLAHEVEQNHRFAVTSVRKVSTESAKFLGLAESHVIDPPAPTVPTDLSVTLTSTPTAPTGRTGSIMNVVLRGYLGFMMFFMLTNFTGLALPIVVGIAPALLLAGVAVHEDLTRQVAARRSVAIQLLRSYITEFGMFASKDSRDLLRELEQDLRNGYGARIGREATER